MLQSPMIFTVSKVEIDLPIININLSLSPSLCLSLSPSVCLSVRLSLSFCHISTVMTARNFETHGTSKRTELRNGRNFEAHGTSKRTELRSARNFERHGTSKMSSKLLCILLYLNPYYSSYLTS